MALKLKGSTSGFTAIDAPATAGDNTLVLPADNGSASQYLQTNGSGVLSWATVTDTTGWTWDTTGTSLTGSSVSVTGIPSDAKIVSCFIDGLSHNTTVDFILRVGTSSGAVTSGYKVGAGYIGASSVASTQRTNGFQGYATGTASKNWNMRFTLTNINGNTWWGENITVADDSGDTHFMWGKVDVGGTLDRVVFLVGSGSLDAGTVYVSYFVP